MKSEWISVEDRLPEDINKKIVFWINEYGAKKISTAQYIHSKSVLAEDFLSDECGDGFSEYDEILDCYWTPSGWYEYQEYSDVNYFMHDEITHWMQLPEYPIL